MLTKVKRNKSGQFVNKGGSPRKGIFKSRKTRICIVCGKTYYTYHKISYTCSRRCWKQSPKTLKAQQENLEKGRKIKNKIARNTLRKNSYGYILRYKPEHSFSNVRGYICEHRFIMEKYLLRYLKKEEVVHHIDGKRDNNSIKNLKLFPNQSLHMKHHKNGN